MSRRARVAVAAGVAAVLWVVGWFTAGALLGVHERGVDLDGIPAGIFVLGLVTVTVAAFAALAAALVGLAVWIERGE